MTEAFKAGHPVTLENIDRFVDGAAVKRVGDLTFSICREVLDECTWYPKEGSVPPSSNYTMKMRLWWNLPVHCQSRHWMIMRKIIKGKNVVCIVSGSNNDIDRMQEIKERSLQYEGLKHYFLIRFAQRPGH